MRSLQCHMAIWKKGLCICCSRVTHGNIVAFSESSFFQATVQLWLMGPCPRALQHWRWRTDLLFHSLDHAEAMGSERTVTPDKSILMPGNDLQPTWKALGRIWCASQRPMELSENVIHRHLLPRHNSTIFKSMDLSRPGCCHHDQKKHE